MAEIWKKKKKTVKIKSVLVGEQAIPTSGFSGVSYVRLTIETKTTRKIMFLFLTLLYSCRDAEKYVRVFYAAEKLFQWSNQKKISIYKKKKK